MRQLSCRAVGVGVAVIGILVGHAMTAGAQAAPAHPAGHAGMKAGGMMMPKDDASYVQMMQMHHQMGIDMAKGAVDTSSREDVRAFAKRMIDAQEKDIEELKPIEASLNPSSRDDHATMMKGSMDKMMADLRAQLKGPRSIASSST